MVVHKNIGNVENWSRNADRKKYQHGMGEGSVENPEINANIFFGPLDECFIKILVNTVAEELVKISELNLFHFGC